MFNDQYLTLIYFLGKVIQWCIFFLPLFYIVIYIYGLSLKPTSLVPICIIINSELLVSNLLDLVRLFI